MRYLAAIFLAFVAQPGVAQVALSSSGTQTTANNPISIAVTVAADDYLIGGFVTDSEAAISTPTYDSPLVQDSTYATAYESMRFYAGSGRATGSDTSLNFSTGEGGVRAPIGAILAFSGVDTTTANDTTAVTANGAGSGSTSTGGMSITTATNDAMLVLVVGVDTTSSTSPTFSVSDGGAGLSWTYITAYETWRKLAIAYAVKPSAGAITVTGNFVVTADFGAVLYALRPGGGSAVPPASQNYRRRRN